MQNNFVSKNEEVGLIAPAVDPTMGLEFWRPVAPLKAGHGTAVWGLGQQPIGKRPVVRGLYTPVVGSASSALGGWRHMLKNIGARPERVHHVEQLFVFDFNFSSAFLTYDLAIGIVDDPRNGPNNMP